MSSYDQALLDEAPKASRAQVQQGYDVDLLEPARRTPSVRGPHSRTSQPTPVPLTSGIADSDPEEKIVPLLNASATAGTKPSFWRSRNGVITIFVIAVVVVGAVVGGAVGGTVNKHGHTNTVSSARSGGPTSNVYSLSSPSGSPTPSSTITAPIGNQGTSSAIPSIVS